MEKELEDAVALYTESLHDLQGQEGVEGVVAELQEALECTRDALSSLRGAGVPEQAEQAHDDASGATEYNQGSGRKSPRSPDAEGEEEEEEEEEDAQAQGSPPQYDSDDGAADAGPSGPHNPRNNNSRMHPRSIHAYRDPDFAALAARHAGLAPLLIRDPRGQRKPSLDFRDHRASRELTRAILADDYGITWDIPESQLVPPVPNRANYVHWIEDLLRLSRPAGQGAGAVRGLDIGAGANLVYPLLGAAIYGWSFVAVDATGVAVDWASRNAAANPHLSDLIEVRRVAVPPGVSGGVLQGKGSTPIEAGGILTPAVKEGETYSFSMCNPPFFDSIAEAGQNPRTAHEGTEEEMVCPGGERSFVVRMIEDSVALGPRIHWYTTMVGKKATMKTARDLLRARGITVVRTTEFFQGRTSRWGLAWSLAAPTEAAMAAIPRDYRPGPHPLARPGPILRVAPSAAAVEAAAQPAAPAVAALGVNPKGCVPRARASVLHRERGGRPEAVLAAFIARMEALGCSRAEALQGSSAPAAASSDPNFSASLACASLPDVFGAQSTLVDVSMRMQDRSTFLFELALPVTQKSSQQHMRRLGWLSASLSFI